MGSKLMDPKVGLVGEHSSPLQAEAESLRLHPWELARSRTDGSRPMESHIVR